MRLSRLPVTIALCTALLATPALARPGNWGGPGWGSDWGDRSYPSRSWNRSRPAGPAEGKVEVTRFIAEDVSVEMLGKGSVSVTGSPVGAGVGDVELKTYEAAVENSLVSAGYQTATTADASAQLVELRVSHDTVVAEEGRRNPVSGEMEVGVSNRGSMVGLGLNIDLSKPKKALISTRLEARIKDRASGKVLWEGRADIITRDGSDKWTDGAIAAKLSAALFDRFPGKSGETRAALR